MTDSRLDGCHCIDIKMDGYGGHTCPRLSMGEITLYVTRMYGEDFTNIIRHKTTQSIRKGDNTYG